MRRVSRLAPLLVAASVSAQELAEEPPPPPPLWEELLRLDARLDSLEAQRAQPGQESGSIDLTGEELTSIGAGNSDTDHVLARPWYEIVAISGYGAFTYLDTGGTGTTEDGSFLVREMSLFFDAQVWERTFLFTEIWIRRYQFGNGFSTGELYLQFTDLLAGDDGDGIGVKVGRFEIPFGEDYLRWDANETPFISFAAADPYGIDEGVQVYGGLGPVDWITAVTNGAEGSGMDDGQGKLFATKLYGDAFRDLYLSGSALTTGDTEVSAFRLSGNTLGPVGAGGPSAAGTSPSDEVSTVCWELDALIARERRAHLGLQYGQATVDDDADAFDRDLSWFKVEPGLRIRDDLELVLRYSAIGTFDDDEGYRFSGKPIAEAESLGFDTSSLRRLAAAVRWFVNPHVAVKAEIGQDRIELIDISPLDEENDERLYFGIELVASF
jgi:hypothetical protein